MIPHLNWTSGMPWVPVEIDYRQIVDFSGGVVAYSQE